MAKLRKKRLPKILRRRQFVNTAMISSVALVVVVGMVIVFHSLAAVQPVGVAGNWNLVFDDEFNGTSLNTSVWNTGWFGTGVTGPVDPLEDACYSSSNISESGGVLNLNLVGQSSTCSGQSEPYTGALVDSDGKYSFTYGYAEARIYSPGNGEIVNWPAWWTDGQSWPTDGEMDILEGLGGKPCWNFHDPTNNNGGCTSGNYSGWHTYGADWEPGIVTFYYDGVNVGSITTGITSAPMYLVLQSTTTTYGGYPVSAPADMQVDYVRVWSYAGPGTPTPAPPHTATPAPVAPSGGGVASGSKQSAPTPTINSTSAASPTPSVASLTPSTSPLSTDTTAGNGASDGSAGDTSVGGAGLIPVSLQSDGTVIKVSGLVTFENPTGTSKSFIEVDGWKASNSNELNTTKLTNGQHSIKFVRTVSGVVVTSKFKIDVTNKLNPWQRSHNVLLAAFRGSGTAVDVTLLLAFALVLGLGWLIWKRIARPNQTSRSPTNFR